MGTFFHVFWTCPIINNFFRNVRIASIIIQKGVPLAPKLFLLGFMQRVIPTNKTVRILYLVTVARIALAKYWKSKDQRRCWSSP